MGFLAGFLFCERSHCVERYEIIFGNNYMGVPIIKPLEGTSTYYLRHCQAHCISITRSWGSSTHGNDMTRGLVFPENNYSRIVTTRVVGRQSGVSVVQEKWDECVCGRFVTTLLPMNRPNIVRCRKGKAVPLQAWSGPEGSRKLKFPDFTTSQDDGKVVSLTHRPPLPPRKYTWYSFLLEAESTPGP
jgi:hypothetical protein